MAVVARLELNDDAPEFVPILAIVSFCCKQRYHTSYPDDRPPPPGLASLNSPSLRLFTGRPHAPLMLVLKL